MYCRNCGKQLNDQAVVCVGCGVRPLNGSAYCQNCGAQTQPAAEVCLSCGARLAAASDARSRLAAGLLGILLGYFGVHRFYLGYTGIGLTQLLITILSLGILSPITWLWGLIEGIMILTGSISTDAAGRPLRD